ncbi:hypothetical protein JCM12681A_31430 [Streptomyces mexicanus]
MPGVHRCPARLLKANEVRVYVVRGRASNGKRSSVSAECPKDGCGRGRGPVPRRGKHRRGRGRRTGAEAVEAPETAGREGRRLRAAGRKAAGAEGRIPRVRRAGKPAGEAPGTAGGGACGSARLFRA